MTSKKNLAKLILVSLFLPFLAFAQPNAGDYRSATTGNWSTPATWERYDGNNWLTALSSPDTSAGVITISSLHTVFITSVVEADQVVAEGSNNLAIDPGAVLRIYNGPGIIDLNLVSGGFGWLGRLHVMQNAIVAGSATVSYFGDTLLNEGYIESDFFALTGSGGSQVISGNGKFWHLLMANPLGAELDGDIRIANLLNFNNGSIVTGPHRVILENAATIQNNSFVQNYVLGNLEKEFAAGSHFFQYRIGNANGYKPVEISVLVTNPGSITASTTPGDSPFLSGSQLDGSKSVNNNWDLIPSPGLTLGTNMNLIFSWDLADIDVGADYTMFIGGFYHIDDEIWVYPTTGTVLDTSIVLTAVSGFGQFAVAEALPPPTIDVNGNFGPFCANDIVSIPYTVTGTYNAGNIFTAYLSDPFGSFGNQTYLGELESGTSGIINGVIPTGISGSEFRIRIVSSNPFISSDDNGSDISITDFTNYYPDIDEDGFGDQSATPLSSCGTVPGFVTNSSDCDDNAALVNPGATEICLNGIDDNCNGFFDETQLSVSPVITYDGDLSVSGCAGDTTFLSVGVIADVRYANSVIAFSNEASPGA